MALEERGYAVALACCAQEAIDAAQKSPPAVLLLDIFLGPRENGILLAKKLRKLAIPDVFTVLVSYADSKEAHEVSSDLKARFLSKTQSIESIAYGLEAMLGDRRSASSPSEVVVGKLVVDQRNEVVRLGGKIFRLAPRQFRMISLLALAFERNPEEIVPTDLLVNVWEGKILFGVSQRMRERKNGAFTFNQNSPEYKRTMVAISSIRKRLKLPPDKGIVNDRRARGFKLVPIS